MDGTARINGLAAAQVEASRRENGSNRIEKMSKASFFKTFISAFNDPIIKILLGALGINILLLNRNANILETAGIAFAVFLSAFVSALSEHSSERAFERMQREAERTVCIVLRDGAYKEIPSTDIVVGDIVRLTAGEAVCADGILLSGELSVDQSALDGESAECRKLPSADARSDISAEGEWRLGDEGRLFRGSTVCSGEGEMLVCRVGGRSLYGGMALELGEATSDSPLKRKLSKLAGTLSRVGYLAAALIFFVSLLNSFFLDGSFYDMSRAEILVRLIHSLTLAISVVVVAAPEGLPMMIAVVLSSNMLRMQRDGVIVRKPIGIETAGSLNILFTDKTGTLTYGKPEVVSLSLASGEAYYNVGSMKGELRELFTLSCVYNSGSATPAAEGGESGERRRVIGGNSADRALLSFVLPLGSGTVRSYRKIGGVPFDSRYKFSSCELDGPRRLVLVKGAPERIISACSHYYNARCERRPISERGGLEAHLEELARSAYRVIAIATSASPVSPNRPMRDLTLLGLVAIRDAVRRESPKAIRELTGAGIQTVMVTGDNMLTAEAIALECGLIGTDRSDYTVIDSERLSALSDDEVKAHMHELRVIARALPSDKSRLVRLAKELGLVAGMTGDGVNDAPALKQADVGFAMGSGCDIAKDSAEIILCENNISTLARAVLYGRTAWHSIRKFLCFQLTMNLCAVGVSVIGPFIGCDTPVTVIQMLWVNIIMDTLAALAFSGEPPQKRYMKEPPKSRDEPILDRSLAARIIWMGGYTVLLCSAFLASGRLSAFVRYDVGGVIFMSAFFALFIFCGIFNSLSARAYDLPLLSGIHRNRAFIFIMSMVAAVQLLLIRYGGSMFRTAPLTAPELRRILLMAATVIPADRLRVVALKAFSALKKRIA